MLKYQAIAADIQHSIEDGSLKPNDKLPTVVELCQIYDVSKITVKRAFDLLIEQGLIASRRGSGTYVKSTQDISDPRGSGTYLVGGSGSFAFNRSDRARGFTIEHQGDGEITSVVYDFSIVNPPEKVARHLNIQPEDFAYHHCRVRCLNGTPIVIEYTYMPLDLIPGLKKSQLYKSVYSYIQDTLGYKISSFHRIIRAVSATEEEAERLETEVGGPLLEMEQIGFFDDGTAFEYSISRNVGDRAELRDVNVV
ncbi:GntR family transcriptional regulator [Collinsella sp. An2]|uniref:GntR family transcriptional regulator n=1 Tax=Collinsella sp. An2 TaxID=1965585 RepID=UPI000B3AC0E3|nr:GntR family transcriptional regulator [Collinsella sp. An2]OUP10828.1 hypothetical protein B5F33_00060 [Collinsella sp. An2]